MCVHSSDDYFILYKLSYLWYVVIGFLLTLLVGVIVSYVVTWFSKEAETIPNPDLFSPLIQGCVKRRYNIKAATDDDDDDVSLLYIKYITNLRIIHMMFITCVVGILHACELMDVKLSHLCQLFAAVNMSSNS